MATQQINVVDLEQAIVVGDNFDIVGTITSNGATLNLTGYTVTCSIYDKRDPANALISGHAVAITTAASGIVTLTVTAAESATLHYYPTDFASAVVHIADFKCVAGGGAIVHSDPWTFLCRRKATA